MDRVDRVEYDEFGLFHENAEEHGLPFLHPPVVRREWIEVAPGRTLSALAWTEDEPELVLLHGGAQNAHTWDTVALALGRPLVAVDLPGHGHSDGPGQGPGGHLGTDGLATDVSVVVRQLAPRARGVIGMSLGGLTAIALASVAPDLVRTLVLVDVLPGIKGPNAKHITDFVSGPPTFTSLDELLERTAQFNPTRSLPSLRRGILHNAQQQEDGTWVWRWARHRAQPLATTPVEAAARDSLYDGLWEALSAVTVPVLLVRGMRSDSVLRDEDEAELARRLPAARVVHVEEAGHSVQGDAPLVLAGLIEQFVFGS